MGHMGPEYILRGNLFCNSDVSPLSALPPSDRIINLVSRHYTIRPHFTSHVTIVNILKSLKHLKVCAADSDGCRVLHSTLQRSFFKRYETKLFESQIKNHLPELINSDSKYLSKKCLFGLQSSEIFGISCIKTRDLFRLK